MTPEQALLILAQIIDKYDRFSLQEATRVQVAIEVLTRAITQAKTPPESPASPGAESPAGESSAC